MVVQRRRVHAAEDGLYHSVFLIFKPGTPPVPTLQTSPDPVFADISLHIGTHKAVEFSR
jgi:hypothetical protein